MASFNFIPLWANHAMTYLATLGVGLCFTFVYFFVMRALILRLDLKTPGREDERDIHFNSKNEYLEAQSKERLARKIVELVGGATNVTDCTSCVTRLRVEVADPALVRPAEEFEEAGAHGVMRAGKVIQVVVGTGVVSVKECFDRLVGTGE